MSAAPTDRPERWYQGITRYQWLVLIIASAGWVFDVYEGQIFNITRPEMLSELLQGDQQAVKRYGDYFLGIFLAGGTFGGLVFGSLADRYGRGSVMIWTILFYSVFSGLTYFAQTIEQVAILRFLVAIGVGGEWAVAASLVSEVFPKKARSQASAIFHATSVLGTWLAAIAGLVVGSEWRYAYLVGILPAFLIIWVRISVKESDSFRTNRDMAQKGELGSFRELLLSGKWAPRAFLGMSLAAVGLGTFWSVTVAGQNLADIKLKAEQQTEATLTSADPAPFYRNAKFAYGIVQVTGGGLGLLAFGPLAARFGRKLTFTGFHLAALIVVPITCFLPQTYNQLLLLLPLYGFVTLGIHSGYAIYFPELFPTSLRATGTSFCFNGGRLVAVPILIYSGNLKASPDVNLPMAIWYLSFLFALGVLIIQFLPETRNQELID